MRAVIQRVAHGAVTVDGTSVGSIGKGLVILLGVATGDGPDDIVYLKEKTLNLRIFPDNNDKFDLSVMDIAGELLIISQFTLFADCRKGRRPSFSAAAPPVLGNQLYEEFVRQMRQSGLNVQTGVFGAKMALTLLNDGPVTIIIDSPGPRIITERGGELVCNHAFGIFNTNLLVE